MYTFSYADDICIKFIVPGIANSRFEPAFQRFRNMERQRDQDARNLQGGSKVGMYFQLLKRMTPKLNLWYCTNYRTNF